MSANTRYADDSATTFNFGEFTYDSGSRLLMCNGAPRHLSPKAQRLLHLLLVARPRALSREELYDALWPSTFVCETNLAGIVNEIRRALGDDARSAQFIRTVHGFGYAFGGEVASAARVPVVSANLVCGEASYSLYPGENVVGRALGADIVLSDATISRRHAVITIYDGDSTFLIKDLESKNGTYVDGTKIGHEPVSVTHDAQIEFGAVVASIVFRKTTTTKLRMLNLTELKRQVAERMTTP